MLRLAFIHANYSMQMKTFAVSINHKRVYQVFSTLFVVLLLMFLAFLVATFYVLHRIIDPRKLWLFVPSFMVVNGSQTMCMMTFIVILFNCYARFDLINVCFKKYFATQEEEVGDARRGKLRKSLPSLVMKLADLHDKLVDTTVQFNHCFSFQMMNVVGAMFGMNIFSTFAIYRVFVRNDYKDFYNATVQFAWNIYFLLYGLTVITVASLVTRTGKYSAV